MRSRRIRTRRREINRSIVGSVPSIAAGLLIVTIGITDQVWQIVVFGVVTVLLPSALIVGRLRLKSRLSDAELDAELVLIRPTLRWREKKNS